MKFASRFAAHILLFAISAFSAHNANANSNKDLPKVVHVGVSNSSATDQSSNFLKTSNHEEWFKKDLPVWVNNFIALFSGIVSLFNLIVVIWFFHQANVDRARERTEDKSERNVRIQQEVGNFWIKELILKTSTLFVHEFFDKFEKEIAAFQTKCGQSSGAVDSLSADSAKLIEEFKTQFHQLDSRVVEPLEWVSPEFQKLRPIMARLEDLVTEEFGTIRLPISKTKVGNEETAEMKFRKVRSDFFKQLHMAHKTFVGL